jgi:hypothetical protein
MCPCGHFLTSSVRLHLFHPSLIARSDDQERRRSRPILTLEQSNPLAEARETATRSPAHFKNRVCGCHKLHDGHPLRNLLPRRRSSASNETDVIEQANNTEFDLASYFLRTISRGYSVSQRRWKYGMVGVNSGLITTAEARLEGSTFQAAAAGAHTTASRNSPSLNRYDRRDSSMNHKSDFRLAVP